MRRLVIAATLLFSACAAGGLKPSIMTSPPGYLQSFPLGSVTETEMISKAGPPDRTIDIDGKKAFVYQFGELLGVRTFTYMFERGVIADVLYNDNGPYNGSTAKKAQNK